MHTAAEIGKIVRDLRGELSLREFARKCDISHTTIDNLEKGIDFRTGKPTQPKTVTLQKIAKACSVPLSHILGDETSIEEPIENDEANVVVSDLYKDHEKALIEAYRNNPGMQEAVDRLLGIQPNDHVLLYQVASSEDHHRDRYITKDKKEWAKIEGTPETDDPLV